MNLQEQIAAFAAEAEAHTGRSKLEPYEALIRTLRQKRWTYAEISAALRERFHVSAAPGTVHSYMKARCRQKLIATMPSRAIHVTTTSSGMKDTDTPKRRFHLDF